MNQTLDVLKNVDGIKIYRLSDKKIHLCYEIPIVSGNLIVDRIVVKIRYKNYHTGNKIIFPKKGFINQISNKYGIKKKFIRYETQKFVKIGENVFDIVILNIRINNLKWHREKVLNNLVI